jgi:outer membrane receptor protein involved in Fe transport
VEKKKIILSITILFSVVAFVYLSSASEMPADSIEVKYYFNPIVKTGTKAAGAQRDLAASISVIGPARLEQIPSSAVFDVVNAYVPGLYLTEWNVMGFGAAGSSAGKFSMRGIGGGADTHVMILRNGRPDFMGLMGCTIADEFATDGVERIEVVRGPASFLYGTNASAGVINVISRKREREGFETRLKAGYGEYNSQKYSIEHGGKKGNIEYNLTAAHRSSDGFRDDAKDTYEGNFYTGHVGYTFSRNTSIEMNTSLADLYLFDPGFITDPNADDWYDILRWGGDLTLTHQSRLGESYLKLHGNFGKHKFFDGWRSSDQMIGVMAYHNVKFTGGNTTTVGFDVKQYGGHAEGSVDYIEKEITEYAPYVYMQQLLLGRLIASAGFRLEHHTLYGTVSIPKVGLVAHITNTNALRLDFSKGFRSPSIRELYFFPPHNEDLKPDEIWNMEAGYTQQIGRTFQIDATVFHNEGDNLIAMAKRVQGPGYQYTNVGQIENNGVEIEATWMPVDRVNLGASWSGIDMKYEIPNVPEKKTTAFVSWQISKLFFSGMLIWVQDLIGQDSASPIPHRYPMADYVVVNFSASYKFFEMFGVGLTIKNVFDADYQTMYGYPMPDRSAFVDVNYDF